MYRRGIKKSKTGPFLAACLRDEMGYCSTGCDSVAGIEWVVVIAIPGWHVKLPQSIMTSVFGNSVTAGTDYDASATSIDMRPTWLPVFHSTFLPQFEHWIMNMGDSSFPVRVSPMSSRCTATWLGEAVACFGNPRGNLFGNLSSWMWFPFDGVRFL